MTEYEHFLYHEWFKSSKIREEVIYARPDIGWKANSLRCFTEVRFGTERFSEEINWRMMAKIIEEDLTFIRIAV